MTRVTPFADGRALRRLGCPLVVCLWALMLASPASAQVFRFGINGDANDSVANRLGVTHVRQSLHWDDVQPRRGVWNWDPADFRVEAAATRGLTLLPVLLGGAPWAGAWNLLPANPRNYARWVARLAARYGPEGAFWRARPSLPYRPLTHFQLWNEPNAEFFSRDGVNPGRYARLVRAAVQAGRAANPRVRYLLQADWTPGEPGRSFIDGMYQAIPDLNRWFDVVALHPYSGDRGPDEPRDPWGFSRIADIRARLVAHGGAEKPVWITEIGWSTCPAGERCVTERQQAAYLRRAYEIVRTTYPYVSRMYAYTGRDDPRGRRSDREAWFGMVRRDDTRKPAFNVIRRILRGR